MTDQPGRRERKKQETRAALTQAAVRLFQEQGYERTTVAQIADAADVSTRTFFLHFPTKEDVLVGSGDTRIALGLRIIADHRPGEGPELVLGRAIEAMIADTAETDLPTGLAGLRAHLAATSPAVQSRLLQRLFPAHEELIDALCSAYPDDLDPLRAAALVGAAVGAVTFTALTSLRQQDDPDQTRRAMITALAVSLPTTRP